jgi:hypothetical protein
MAQIKLFGVAVVGFKSGDQHGPVRGETVLDDYL